MRGALVFAIVLGGPASSVGCSVEADAAAASSGVVGTLDWSHPEVGVVGECSATLLTFDTALTAPGCTADEFVAHRAGGAVAGRFGIASRIRVEGLSLLHLSVPVPPSIAKPLDVAGALPDDGAPVTQVGYGCASAIDDARKRSAPLTWNGERQTTDRDVSCPGSMGAPVLDGAGRVVAMRTSAGLALVVPTASAIRVSLASSR